MLPPVGKSLGGRIPPQIVSKTSDEPETSEGQPRRTISLTTPRPASTSRLTRRLLHRMQDLGVPDTSHPRPQGLQPVRASRRCAATASRSTGPDSYPSTPSKTNSPSPWTAAPKHRRPPQAGEAPQGGYIGDGITPQVFLGSGHGRESTTAGGVPTDRDKPWEVRSQRGRG